MMKKNNGIGHSSSSYHPGVGSSGGGSQYHSGNSYGNGRVYQPTGGNSYSSSSIPHYSERASYHSGSHQMSGSNLPAQVVKLCLNCETKVAISECQQFRCEACGIYVVCDYCYDEMINDEDAYYQETSSAPSGYHNHGGDHNYPAKSAFGGQQAGSSQAFLQKIGTYQKLKCFFCGSKHQLDDITMAKSLKSFGFIPIKGTNKIPISSLGKEKIKKLANLRVIQKTLVYVIGLAPEIASEEILKSQEYFGQFGDLTKVVVNTHNVYNANKCGPSYAAYLTFSHPRESAIAILAVDQFSLYDRVLLASFGTSKFCQFFMNGQKCTNKDCLYLHEIRTDNEAYTKEDMQNNRFIFQEQHKIAIKLSRALEMSLDEFKLYNKQNNKNYPSESGFKPVLPPSEIIYYKDFHFLDVPLIKRPPPVKEEKVETMKVEPAYTPKVTLVTAEPIVEIAKPPSVTLETKVSSPVKQYAPKDLKQSHSVERSHRTVTSVNISMPVKAIEESIEVVISKELDNEETLNEDQMEMIEGMIADLDDQKSNGPNDPVIEEQKRSATPEVKTPPHNVIDNESTSESNHFVMQLSQLLSPMLFKKKEKSRFQFAQSLDPIKSAFTGFDWDEIEVPAKIQDLIEKNIRTLSNNSMPKCVKGTALDLKDVKELWLTKKELLNISSEEPSPMRRSTLEETKQEAPKFKPKLAQPVLPLATPSIFEKPAAQGYDLTEHSANIRVKYDFPSRLSIGKEEPSSLEPSERQSPSNMKPIQMQYVPVSTQPKYKPVGSTISSKVLPSTVTTAASYSNSSTNKQRSRRKEDKRADRVYVATSSYFGGYSQAGYQ